MRHFEQVVERIGAEPFVVRTRSVIVLSRLVSRAGFPPRAWMGRAVQTSQAGPYRAFR